MTPAERIETVIVGGGQAGLATSYWLTQRGRPHLVLEQAARPGHVWHDDRWDSFTLVTPNWRIRLPGAAYAGDAPDGFLPRDEIVEYFARYVADFRLPIRYGTRVLEVERADDGGTYRIQTATARYETTNVVIATGLYQRPKIPAFASGLPAEVAQLHSGAYRRPEGIAPGAALVVGSEQSGCQIAEELSQSGREVYLCVGHAGRMPRRYRGLDAWAWAYLMGTANRTVDQLADPRERFEAHPHLSGKGGGHTINLHRFARDGVGLLGHLRDAHDGHLSLAPDLHEGLAAADKLDADFRAGVDRYVEQMGMDAPPRGSARARGWLRAGGTDRTGPRGGGHPYGDLGHRLRLRHRPRQGADLRRARLSRAHGGRHALAWALFRRPPLAAHARVGAALRRGRRRGLDRGRHHPQGAPGAAFGRGRRSFSTGAARVSLGGRPRARGGLGAFIQRVKGSFAWSISR